MVLQETQEAMQEALRPEQLAEYSIVGRDADFEDTLGGKLPISGVVSMKVRTVFLLNGVGVLARLSECTSPGSTNVWSPHHCHALWFWAVSFVANLCNLRTRMARLVVVDEKIGNRFGEHGPRFEYMSFVSQADVKGKSAAAAQLYKKGDKKGDRKGDKKGDKGRKHKGDSRQKSGGQKKRKTQS